MDGKRVNYVSEVDQVNVIDPMDIELAAIRAEIARIEAQEERDGSGI